MFLSSIFCAFSASCATGTTAWTSLQDLDFDSSAAGIQNVLRSLNSSARLGSTVALSENYVAAAAAGYTASTGNIYLYSLSANSLLDVHNFDFVINNQLTGASEFGTAIATYRNTTPNPDQIKIAIGAPGANQGRGTVFLLEDADDSDILVAPKWTDLGADLVGHSDVTNGLAACTDAACTDGSRFGTAVAIDSHFVLIGAPGESSNRGNAYLYRHTGEGDDFDFNCLSAGASGPVNRSWCNIASVDTNTDRTDGIQNPIQSLNAGARLGTSVALATNLFNNPPPTSVRSIAVLGAPEATASGVTPGKTFLRSFDTTLRYSSNCAASGTGTTAWCDMSRTFRYPSGNISDGARFGAAVATSGQYLVIGAPNASSNPGDAFLYRVDGSTAFLGCDISPGTSGAHAPWCRVSVATDAPTLASGDRFGAAGRA